MDSLNRYVERAKRMQCPDGGYFTESADELVRLLQPTFCTVIKNSFRSWVRHVGACERCGTTTNLQRAHRRDCSRPKLLKEAIARVARLVEGGSQLMVGHRELRDAFLDLHRDDAVGRRLLCLCSTCHRAYDAGSGATGAANAP